MSLTLSAAAQHRLAEAIRVLASPLAYASEAEWRTLATEHARDAVGTGMGVMTMTAGDGLEASVAGGDPKRLADYQRFFPLLEQHGVLDRALRLGACTRREIYGPAYDALARTDYAQDFLPSIPSYDGLSFVAPLVPRPQSFAETVQLTLSVTEPDRRIGEHHRLTGGLLYPAFTAGVQTLMTLRGTRARLRATLDATGMACVVSDRSGRHVHCTPALEALCTREPQREALVSLAGRVARSFWSEAPAPRASLQGAVADYTLAATEVHDGRDPYCVVAVVVQERPSPPRRGLTSEARTNLGLTPRQAEVAVLLAARRTNREIAADLSVSVHTARHHVEAVLVRLGVARTGVADALTPRV